MFVNNLYVAWFQVAEIEDNVESIHEVDGIVAGSSITKIGRKRKLLQTLDKVGTTRAPNTSNFVDLLENATRQWLEPQFVTIKYYKYYNYNY
jgi:hypothetical protein